MLKQLIMNTVVQWSLLLFIPILIYLIFFRKKVSFLLFFGLKKPEKVQAKLLFKASILSTAFVIISIFWLQKYNVGVDDIRLLSFKQTGFSMETISIIFIQSIVLTSFLEEIIFRGFLINALRYKIDFNISNHIQAFVFTGLHIFAMSGFSLIDIVIGIIIIYVLSLYFGKLTKNSGYSIFYSSVFHGLLNIIAGVILILMNI